MFILTDIKTLNCEHYIQRSALCDAEYRESDDGRAHQEL